MSKNELWSLTKQTFSEWWEDNVSRLSAALAYYTVFAIAPLLVIAIAITGFVFGRDAAQGVVYDQSKQMLGDAAAKALQNMIKNAGETGSGLFATILGIILLIYAATNVFASLQDSLNTIWEVKPSPNAGWWTTVRNRLLSFGMVVGIAFLLMVSLILSAVIAAAIKFVGMSGQGWLWQVANFLVFIPVACLLFAMIFKVLPDVKIAWGEVWIGAAVTAVLFAIGKVLIGFYLGQGSVTSVYGAAGSLVVLLIWVYYSAQIVFLGAEFTQVYARRTGSSLEPAREAVALTEDDRAQQGIPRQKDLQHEADAQEGHAGRGRDASAEGSGRHSAVARPKPMIPNTRVIRFPEPQEDAMDKPLAAGAGLLAGLLVGGVGAFYTLRKRQLRRALGAAHVDRRLDHLEQRVAQVQAFKKYARELQLRERLDEIEERIGQAQRAQRRRQAAAAPGLWSALKRLAGLRPPKPSVGQRLSRFFHLDEAVGVK
jgi:membrane protein